MDTEQAGLVLDSVRGFCARSPLLADIVITNREVRNQATGSQIRVMSSDSDSAYGLRPRLCVFDELSLQRDDKLWTSMFSAIGKNPQSQLIALSMAGTDFESIGWRVHEVARTTEEYFFQTRAGTELAPWLSKDNYEEQRRMLHPALFSSLWDCLWSEPQGAWITREMYEDAEVGKEAMGGSEFAHVAFVDIGLVHDATAIAVCHREGEKVVLDTLVTLQGTRNYPVELEAVEDTIADLAERFRLRSVMFEAPQAVASVQRLAKRLSCKVEARYPTMQTQADLFGNLYRLFANHLLVVYPHDQLRKEALHLVVKNQGGRLKVVDSGPQIHQDCVVALGGACQMLKKGIQDWNAVYGLSKCPECGRPMYRTCQACSTGGQSQRKLASMPGAMPISRN